MHGSATAFWRFLLALLAALALAGVATAATFSGKRVALVIGNGKYPTAPLKNPVNDARAMAKTLKELGFEVTLRENATQRDMAAAVRQFGSSISPGSAALFYFAGHGMQVKGRNYLVPTDADIQLEDEVPYAAIDVNLVLDKMEVGKSAINLVVLDACRNNPFARRFRSSATGLAQMDAPVGTLIAFATAPGSVAQDGTGENGIYTKHLLESIAAPGLPVEQMFKRVRVGVAKETNDSQIPWESSSMKGDFVFRDAPPQTAASQEKMIEEAVRAAAEKAAAMTAERMRREQAGSTSQAERARAEQEALAVEREKLQRERERLEAERAALRKESSTPATKVALAAPAIAATPPSPRKQVTNDALPEVGDRWTYRFSDGYGKTETYTVRVTDVTAEGIKDEAISGKARHAASHESGLDLSGRLLGSLSLREFAPYLQALGPSQPNAEWKSIQMPNGSGYFVARWAGKERINVPAGSFETDKLVVEGDQFARGMQTRRFTIHVWYAPTAKRFIKIKFAAPHIGSGLGEEKDVIELVDTSIAIGKMGMTTPAASTLPQVTVASLTPPSAQMTPGGFPKLGDSWTYRFSDVYGKSAVYTVRVTAASPTEITDEIRLGKARHIASFDSGLMVIHRKLDNLSLREFSPYLPNFGLKESEEWKRVEVFEGKEPFAAKLVGTESVQAPAGTFEAQKIVIEGREYGTRMTHLSRPYTITAWYAPAVRRFVRLTYLGAPSGSFPVEQETIELMEFRLQ